MANQNFGVGPSALFPGLDGKLVEIIRSGILEKSHRSPEFSEMSEKTIAALRRFLRIPESYKIFYTASATEAMQISLQNGVQKKSVHFSTGAFGRKWAKIAKNCGIDAAHFPAEFGERASLDEIFSKTPADAEGIFLTGSETTTGAGFSPEEISEIRAKFPEKFLALDATSAAGAIDFEIKNVDVFLFSIQKCFGVPSGLGILICSPRFFAAAEERNFVGHFHNLPAMVPRMSAKFQTLETPPVFQIAALRAVIELIEAQIGDLKKCAKFTREKFEILENFFDAADDFEILVSEKKFRSPTILVAKTAPEKVAEIHEKAKAEEFFFASGYGDLKKETFRLANFLASGKSDFEKVCEFLKK